MKRKTYTQGVTFFLAPEMYEALKKLSDENQVSLSELLRNIIELFLGGRAA
jgi:predicted DNA-binding protein